LLTFNFDILHPNDVAIPRMNEIVSLQSYKGDLLPCCAHVVQCRKRLNERQDETIVCVWLVASQCDTERKMNKWRFNKNKTGANQLTNATRINP